MNTGEGRKTLAKVGLTPHPQELYDKLISAPGWPYKTNADFYHIRDRALVAILYTGELRVSEALRLQYGQYSENRESLVFSQVALSKCRKNPTSQKQPKTRIVQLPKRGERACFTKLVKEYLDLLKENDAISTTRLFPWSLKIVTTKINDYHWKDGKTVTDRVSVKMVGTTRAWQIVNNLLPELTQHWLRVYGEKYLYKKLGKDIIAVSKIVKVDPRTAIKYLMAGEADYPVY